MAQDFNTFSKPSTGPGAQTQAEGTMAFLLAKDSLPTGPINKIYKMSLDGLKEWLGYTLDNIAENGHMAFRQIGIQTNSNNAPPNRFIHENNVTAPGKVLGGVSVHNKQATVYKLLGQADFISGASPGDAEYQIRVGKNWLTKPGLYIDSDQKVTIGEWVGKAGTHMVVAQPGGVLDYQAIPQPGEAPDLSDYYTKTESDGRYYTKATSDDRFNRKISGTDDYIPIFSAATTGGLKDSGLKDNGVHIEMKNRYSFKVYNGSTHIASWSVNAFGGSYSAATTYHAFLGGRGIATSIPGQATLNHSVNMTWKFGAPSTTSDLPISRVFEIEVNGTVYQLYGRVKP